MGKCVRFGIAASAFILSTTISVYGHEDEGPETPAPVAANASLSELCDKFLAENHERGIAAASELDPTLVLLDGVFPLTDFVTPDASGKTLAQKHPTVILNAAQRLLALINSQGVRPMNDPNTGEENAIRRYSLFSDGLEVANGKRIIGQHVPIDHFVGQIKLLAEGYRSGLKVATLVGGPGTGKSEVIEIFRAALKNLSLNDPRFYFLSYRWKNLAAVPALRDRFQREDGSSIVYDCPIHDSPFVTLPEVFKSAVLREAGPEARRFSGYNPSPKKKMCPHCQKIANEIAKHAAVGLGKSVGQLTPAELFAALNSHVEVYRYQMGTDSTAPIIDPRRRDVDLPSLFASKNPAIAFANGESDPFAYNLNGRIFAANGGPVLLEELLKNSADLLDALLTAIQARRFSIDGSQEVEFDVVFIGATNRDDVREVSARTKDHKSPIIDRLQLLGMEWSTKPQDIQAIATYEAQQFQMRPLGNDAAPWVPVNLHLHELFPEPTSPFRRALGPDGRYDLRIDTPSDDGVPTVHVGPHALSYMSRVAALSRMVLKPDAIRDLMKRFGTEGSDVPAPLYIDPVDRLRVLEGTPDVRPAQLVEFWRISTLLDEGHFGIGARDVSGWFGRSAQEAQRTGRGGCITPGSIKRVLEQMLLKGTIGKDAAERAEITEHALTVANRMLVKEWKRDLMSGLGQAVSGDEINTMYDEVIEEVIQLHHNSGATTYQRAGGRPKPINMARLEVIKTLYQQETGRKFNLAEVALFVLEQQRVAAEAGAQGNVRREPSLMTVLSDYVANAQLAAMETTLNRLVSIVGGTAPNVTDAERTNADTLMREMRLRYGYCPVCLREAAEILRSAPAGAPQNHNH